MEAVETKNRLFGDLQYQLDGIKKGALALDCAFQDLCSEETKSNAIKQLQDTFSTKNLNSLHRAFTTYTEAEGYTRAGPLEALADHLGKLFAVAINAKKSEAAKDLPELIGKLDDSLTAAKTLYLSNRNQGQPSPLLRIKDIIKEHVPNMQFDDLAHQSLKNAINALREKFTSPEPQLNSQSHR